MQHHRLSVRELVFHIPLIEPNTANEFLIAFNQGGKNNYLKVDIGEQVPCMGAIVHVETSTKKLTDHLVTGEGLGSDQTALLHFGLGADTKVNKVTVKYIDGSEDVIDNPKINSILKVQKTMSDEPSNEG